MSIRPFIAALLLTGSVPAMADTFDVSLSDDSAKFSYTAPMGEQGFGRGEVDGSLLFNDDDAVAAAVGFGVMGEAGTGSPGLLAGVGVRLYGVHSKRSDVAALALGGRLVFVPPVLPRLRIGGEVNFAPSIITFIDGDRFYDNSAYVGYEIFQDAVVSVGVRRVRASIENGADVTVDKGAFVGVSFNF